MGTAIVAALITAGVSGLTSWLSTNAQIKANKLASAESANSAIRQYNDSVQRQKKDYETYTKNTTTTYGSDFLEALMSGASTEELIQSIGADTTLGKQIQQYKDEADQYVANAMTSNQQTGMLAARQGQENATEMISLRTQAEQAMGAAASSEATSGIKSTAGTGANAENIQKQANETAEKKLSQQITLKNNQTIVGMQQTQESANQNAESLRKKTDLTAQSAAEEALANYETFTTEMKEADRTQASYKADAEYYTENAGKENVDWLNWMNPEAWGSDYRGNVNESYDEDTINFAD
jgi:hypothetical protein